MADQSYRLQLHPARPDGRMIYDQGGYRIMQHPDCYEITYAGWHLSAVNFYEEALKYVAECRAYDAQLAREMAQ